MDDGLFWMERGTFTLDEAALRLHHRLVKVHPFPNGNGRHARLWCDTLLRQQGRPPFAWRSRELDQVGEARHAYVGALQAADGSDYEPLFTLYLSSRPPA
jgi:fido (protein-threonine AMPylation protein)